VAHPDWCLHVPGRPRQLGRNQMVLDFSRQEVRDHIYNALAAILSR
jgi:alpha-galactosidase